MVLFFRRSLIALCALMFVSALSSCSEDTLAPDVKKPIVSGPGSVDFGAVSVGSCKDTTIRYDNTTGKAVTITSVTFIGTGYEWTGSTLPVEVAAGASIDLKLRFCPSAMDTAKATLTFKGTGGDSVRVTLSGFSTNVNPGPGSIFIYDTYETDASGAKIAGSEGEQQDIFISTNTTFEGKSNVYVVSEEGILNHYAQESNGDVSTYLDAQQAGPFGSLIAGWKQLPYGSKRQNVELLRTDTVVDLPIGSGTVRAKATITQLASYAGETQMTVGGNSYTVENVTFTTTVDLVGELFPVPIGTIINVVKGGYIRSIGYQGTFESQLTSTGAVTSVIPGGGGGKVLKSFEIK
jgi:hypothetical protein